jgi:hypothetical protein
MVLDVKTKNYRNNYHKVRICRSYNQNLARTLLRLNRSMVPYSLVVTEAARLRSNRGALVTKVGNSPFPFRYYLLVLSGSVC